MTKTTARTLAPAVLVGILGFLLTLDLRAHSVLDADERRASLAQIAATRQRRTAELEQRLGDLRAQFVDAASRSGGRELRRVRADLERLSTLAGLAPMEGPGLVLRLADADQPDRGIHHGDTRIQDVDLQAIVNTLWLAGAEAIAINGQRLVSSTAIRNAGGAVLVNFRVLTSPYTVSAIGSRAQLDQRFAASEIARRFRAWVEIYGLGFTVSSRDDVAVPAYAGSLRFTHAKPTGG